MNQLVSTDQNLAAFDLHNSTDMRHKHIFFSER